MDVFGKPVAQNFEKCVPTPKLGILSKIVNIFLAISPDFIHKNGRFPGSWHLKRFHSRKSQKGVRNRCLIFYDNMILFNIINDSLNDSRASSSTVTNPKKQKFHFGRAKEPRDQLRIDVFLSFNLLRISARIFSCSRQTEKRIISLDRDETCKLQH